jgi:hypothetical protein
VLSEAESIELLTKIVDAELTSRIENEIETAKDICRYLGYLPLALELVAKYLKDDRMLSLEDYLQQLSLEDESLSDEMVRGIKAERGVIAAFNLSWQRLQGLATQLAMLLGRFAAAAIPWQELVEPTINSLGWEKKAVKDARKHLDNLSLIEIENGKNIVIHALLREYFRYQSKQEGDDFIHVLQGGIASSGIAVAKTIPQYPVIADIDRVRLAIPHLELLSQEMLDDIPNPDDNFNLIIHSVEDNKAGTMQLIDLNGRVLLEKNLSLNKGINLFQIDNVSNLVKGTYIISVSGDSLETTQIKHIIK